MVSFAIICEGISENLSLHAIVEKMSQTDSYFADIQPRTDKSHIDKINQELRKDKGGYYIPEKGKNGANARSTYQFVLKKMKRKDIPNISQYNYGFKKFVEQMNAIKDVIVEAE